MNFPIYIAKRYLFSKKSQNVINIISGVSVIGVAVGTMALIAILSVFNGFDGLIRSMFNAFDPDLKIESVQGKTFSPDDEKIKKIIKQQGIAYYAEIIEDNALVRHKDRQHVARIKGVSEHFTQVCGIDSMITNGNFMLKDNSNYFAVLGSGVAYFLSAAPGNIEPLQIYAPRRDLSASDMENAFTIKPILTSGIFSIQQDFDSKYIIVPIDFTRELFNYPINISSMELKIQKGFNLNEIQKNISAILGKEFSVKNRFQQNELLFKVMNSEKMAIFIILSFILFIASFNILGSLTMLIIDKKHDIGILQSLGADKKTIRKIFLFEGWGISVLGALTGLIFGFILCFIQQEFRIVKLGSAGGSFIIDAYPVKMQISDFVIVFFTVLLIGFFAAWYPVRFMTKKYLSLK